MPQRECVSLYTGSLGFATLIPHGARVAIVGTGPGAIDCARYCLEHHGCARPVDLVSRHGWLSRVQTLNAPDPSAAVAVEIAVKKLEAAGIVSLADVSSALLPLFTAADDEFDFVRLTRTEVDPLTALTRDLEEARRDGPRYRHVLEAVGARMPRIWRCLGDADREAFRNAYERLYYIYRHAMPIHTAEWIADRLRGGSLRIGCEPRWKLRRQDVLAEIKFLPGGHERVRYDHVVVATGPEWDVARHATRLQRQLLDSGLGRRHPFGGFETRNFELTTGANIFAMGGLVRGEDYAVHSLPALVRHAETIEAQIAQRLKRARS